MIKFAIFDLDGTLCDTLDTIRHYVNITIEKYGAEPITREECRLFVGCGAKNLIACSMDARGVSPTLFDEVFAAYKAAYNQDPYHTTVPYEGIMEMLDGLRAANIKLAVLSNKQNEAAVSAVNHFFGGIFDAVFGGREGIPLKPDKRAFEGILAELSANADEVAYIGDSEVDVQTIKAANPALGIAVSYGFRTREELLAAGAEIILDTPLQVLEYIKKEA